MFDIFKLYATDEKKENEGVVIDLGGGATMTVARRGNENYVRMLQAELEKHGEALNTLSSAESATLDRQIMTRVLAETILLNFTGFSYDGKPLPYSKENAVKALQHKDFMKRVALEADKLEHYRVASEEQKVKN